MPSRIGSSGKSGLPKPERKAERSKVVVASGMTRATGFTLVLSSLVIYIIAVTLSLITCKYITNKTRVI